MKSTLKATKPTAKGFKKSVKPVIKAVKSAKGKKPSPKFHARYPHATSNPFREGSSYGIAFDIMAAHPQGMPRQQLIGELAKITRKPVKNAGYDAAVLLSARPDGRHQSCRPGFVVVRENDNVRLEITAPAAAA